MWVTIPYKEEELKYSYEPHVFKKLYKSIPYEVCIYCGLVALRNINTKWAMKIGCSWRLHSDASKYRG
jgi:hypothetical protein